MNSTLLARFNRYQQLLIESRVVSDFTIVRQHVSSENGNIRMRVALADGGLLELAEYVALDNDNQIVDHTYSFHWQDKSQQLIQRWDNVNHYPQLPFAPHHIHQRDGTVVGNSQLPTLTLVLSKIESYIA